MREFIRPVATAFSIACLSMAVVSTGAFAQAKMAPAPSAQEQQAPPPVKQMALSDKQIEGVL